MNSAFAAVKDHLDRNEWNYDAREDDGVIATGFAGDTSEFELYLEPLDDVGLLKLFAPYPNLVPPASRPAVLEFCNLVNKNASLGRMILDPAEGRVATAVVTAFEPGDLRDRVITHCLVACINHCEVFQPAVLSIVHGNVAPQAAMDAAIAAHEARQAARAAKPSE